MGRKKSAVIKDPLKKVVRKKKTKKATPASGIFNAFHSPQFKCRQSRNDDKFYCYQRVQGRWEESQGPFETLEECRESTGAP